MSSAFLVRLGDLSPVFNFFAWWFLPGYMSSFALGAFYRLRPSYRPKPLPPQPTDANQKPVFDPIYEIHKAEQTNHLKRHRTMAHACVIILYLVYTVLSTYYKQAGTNHYSTLGLRSNSIASNLPFPSTQNKVIDSTPVLSEGQIDDSGFKSHWRKLAKAFHPDKLNPPSNLGSEEEVLEWKSEIESKFIGMREAYETLSDGTKRWAYDRFGPVIATWKNCATLREFLMEGLKLLAPFYTFTIASLSLIGTFRKTDPGAFWRWTVLLCIFAAELSLITSTATTWVSSLLSFIFPNRTIFEHIALLRQIFVACSCIATQLAGIRYPPPADLDKTQNVGQLMAPIMPLLDRAQQYSTLANTEVVKMIYNDLYPILHADASSQNGRRLSLESEDAVAKVNGGPEGSSNETKKEVDPAEEIRMQETIKTLKTKMLEVFCDLRLQSNDAGRAAWNQAIREEARRQNIHDR
ncbi:uncharacterized protein MELLADRAFT_116707 [Melampsora larici-populina 98AG31]|uniref:J domain-containing protein n=1 Tax=Melampsora larici-populina (strain 98AG31 / pathotype 3-4-7) TaxID=747676 RepID=F4RP94_MELLP|nr:uncharacterized protein MELLADRAFT_116707 [Melampsora larici-populina 98AG31]EGG05889.1 hypothetical protein MELLADRAFT_116707 [Melampsora larici-populina 98AG31]